METKIQTASGIEIQEVNTKERRLRMIEQVPMGPLLQDMEVTHSQIIALRPKVVNTAKANKENRIIKEVATIEECRTYEKAKRRLSIAEIELFTRLLRSPEARLQFSFCLSYFASEMLDTFKLKAARYKLIVATMAMLSKNPANTIILPTPEQIDQLNISFFVKQGKSSKITPVVIVTDRSGTPLSAYANGIEGYLPINLPRQTKVLPSLPNINVQMRYSPAAIFTKKNMSDFTPPLLLMINDSAVVFNRRVVGVKPDEYFLGGSSYPVYEFVKAKKSKEASS